MQMETQIKLSVCVMYNHQQTHHGMKTNHHDMYAERTKQAILYVMPLLSRTDIFAVLGLDAEIREGLIFF